MTEQEKLQHCVGCRDDFYNHNGNSPSGKCWSLPSMKLDWRKEVHVDQRPPWTQKAKRLPTCYHRPRYVYVGKDQTY